jgi:molybdenum cofactor biosynthesis enzyme MoaA
VAELRAARIAVQLIFTHTCKNQDQLEPVLRCALEWGVDVQVVDLIRSRAGDSRDTLGYVPGVYSERIVARYAKIERVVRDRAGAVLKLFRTARGATWEVKDYHFGVLHSAMCSGCPLRSECGEGIYALRVDALGIAKPCLLREDLEFDLRIADSSVDSLAHTLRQTIVRMLMPPREWSYEGVSSA